MTTDEKSPPRLAGEAAAADFNAALDALLDFAPADGLAEARAELLDVFTHAIATATEYGMAAATNAAVEVLDSLHGDGRIH